MGVDGVLQRIRHRIAAAGSQNALAREWKISAPYLSDVLKGNRTPGPTILKKLGLCVHRTVTLDYRPIE